MDYSNMTKIIRHLSTALLMALLVPMTACEAEPGDTAISTTVPEIAAPKLADDAKAADSPPANIEYEAGKHYQVLDKPVMTVDTKRIEVNEVFWYGCSHCFSFEPLLEEWAKTLPEDAVLVRTPANWHPNMELHARAYYTAKALKVLDKVGQPIFEALIVKKKKLDKEKDIEAIFVKEGGVEPEKFRKTFSSFGVNSAVRQADSRQRAYQITGTPEMIVNGKYRVSSGMGGGHKGMLAVVTHLIEKERAALAEKATQDSSEAAETSSEVD